MKRDPNDKNLKAWHNKKRMMKCKRLFEIEGVTTETVDILLETVIKDKAAQGQNLDSKMLGVIINFLKLKQDAAKANPLDAAIADAQSFEKEE